MPRDREALLRQGVSKGDVERFTEGDCHYLARAIHRLTGWPMCAFDDYGDPDLHAFVRMPDGLLLDVEGVKTIGEMRDRWRDWRAIGEFEWIEFRRLWGPPDFSHHTYRRAREIARRLTAGVAA